VRILLIIILHLPLFSFSQNADVLVARHLKAVKAKQWTKLERLKLEYEIETKRLPITYTIWYDKTLGLKILHAYKGRNGKTFKNFSLNRTDGQGWITARAETVGDEEIGPSLHKMDSTEVLRAFNKRFFESIFYRTKNIENAYTYQGTETIKDIAYHKFVVREGKEAWYVYLNPLNYQIDQMFLISSHYESFYKFETFEEEEKLSIPSRFKTERGTYVLKSVQVHPEFEASEFEKRSVKQ